MTNDEIADLVRQRDEARARRDWTRADALRERLLSIRNIGPITYRVALLDEPGGTFWYWTTH